MSRSSRFAAPIALALVPLALAACNAVGPTAVRGAQVPYNEAVASNRDEQLLLNLVRLRYRDVPLFLELGTLSTQYQMNHSGGLGTRFVFDDSLDEHGLNASASFGFSEKPTVTYVPLQGEKFVKQLMAPIPLENLFLLAQSGWSLGRVLRCCAQSLEDVRNAPAASGPTPSYVPEFRDFARVGRLARDLQLAGGFDLVQTPGADGGTRLGVRIEGAAQPAADLKSALHLDAARTDFPLVTRRGRGSGADVGVETRSLLGVMFLLSHAIEVPPEDLAAGRVTRTVSADGTPFEWTEVTGDLLRVRTSSSRPSGAYLAVPYRGAWFSIDDADLDSKTTFALLSYLFALQSGDRASIAPALTLPL